VWRRTPQLNEVAGVLVERTDCCIQGEVTLRKTSADAGHGLVSRFPSSGGPGRNLRKPTGREVSARA